MSVSDCFGLDDPESPLLAEARAGWERWCAQDPTIAVGDHLDDLRTWTAQADRSDKDRLLAALARLTRDDRAAVAALVWLLIPGAVRVADSLRDLSPDIDDLVAGQLWIEASRSHRLPPRGIARAILATTRREVTATFGIGHLAQRRDHAWSRTVVLDLMVDSPHVPPAYADVGDVEDGLVEASRLMEEALRNRTIEARDIWLLHELAIAAHALSAPLRRGRCGLTSPAVVDQVAESRPEASRTLRRRAAKALDELAAYVAIRDDPDLVAQWRRTHPERMPTERELLEEEARFEQAFAEWQAERRDRRAS
ncbi:MAG: hypothetical protein ACRDS9_25980 [Pseudonocardiaceae bacterium]